MSNKIKSVFKRMIRFLVIRSFFRPYYFIRTAWPVWYYLLNWKGRKLYQKSRGRYGEAEQRILGDLQRFGVAIATLDELFPGSGVLKELQTYAMNLLPHAKRDSDKTFLKKLWDFRENNILDFNNPFMKLALSDKVLSIVNGYMGMYSKFFYHSLNVTFPVTQDSDPKKSQRWHRDHEDKKVCKMFLYLSDVDEGAGPFIYVLESHHGGRWNKTFRQIPPDGIYPLAGELEARIPSTAFKVATGKAGTVIFCDTIGLHRGGYAKFKERMMFTAEYSSAASFIMQNYIFSGDHWRLGPAAQFAIDKRRGATLRVLDVLCRFSIHRNLF